MKTLTTPNLSKNQPFRQWLEWKIPDTDLTIEGYSRAGDKTYFYIPQLKISLDASLPEGRKGDFVFITHGHSDHITDLEFLSSRKGVQIYAPESLPEILDQFITASRQIGHYGAYDRSIRGEDYTIHGVNENSTIEFKRKRQGYQVRPFNCDHTVPCIGYAFSMDKKRLKPEFAELKETMSQAEFGKLLGSKRKEGIEVQEHYNQPLFAYAGDTHATNYEHLDWLWEYPYLITECTYIREEDREKADMRRHTHWEDLRPYVLANPQTTFVLIHFSLRYSDAEIVAFFENEQEKYGFENVKLWASAAPALNQQGQPS